MSNVIDNFNLLRSMDIMKKNMQELLEVSQHAAQVMETNGDSSLHESVDKLTETVGVIAETQTKLTQFYKGEITLAELEEFRDKITALRPSPPCE